MRRVLRIDSHWAFQIAAARAVLAGGLLSLLSHHLALGPVGAALGAVLLLGAALFPPRSLRQGALLLLLGAIGGALGRTSLGALAPSLAWALPLGLYGALAAEALPRWQRLVLGAAATLLGAGAGLVPAALQAQDAVAELPGALPQVLSGMALGLVVGSSALLGRLRVALDPVDRELLSLLPAPAEADEIGGLVQRAFDTYKEVAAVLEPHPQARAAAEDLVKKIARFGKRWREIEAEARRSGRPDLLAQKEALAARLEASQDEQARAEYERALGGLQAQLDYLQEIDAGRERAVARLHNQVATLGRLRLAALRHRSVDAGKLGEELKAVVEDLGRAGRDLDAAAEALAEAPV